MKARGLLKAVLWAGAALAICGLALMIAGAYGEDTNTPWADVVFFTGLGAFFFDCAVVIIAALAINRKNKRAREQKLASFAENESLLWDEAVRFTDRGMERVQDVVFEEGASIVPYDAMKIYETLYYATPKRRGKERKFLVLPASFYRDEAWEEETDLVETGPASVPLDERTEKIALAHGVARIDKRCSVDPKQRPLKKFFRKEKNRTAKIAGFLTVVALGFALILGIGVWVSLTTDVSPGIFGGIGAAFLTPVILSGLSLFRRVGVVIYEGGVYIKASQPSYGKSIFVPIGEIEKIGQEQFEGSLLVSIDVGYSAYFFSDDGLFEYLKERFPALCGEEI